MESLESECLVEEFLIFFLTGGFFERKKVLYFGVVGLYSHSNIYIYIYNINCPFFFSFFFFFFLVEAGKPFSWRFSSA